MKIQKLGRTFLLGILLALLTTGAAFASEGDPVEIVGTVIAIYPEDFTLEIEVDTGEVFLVHMGQNFDFDTLDTGDLIEVKGTRNEDGTLELTELKIQERARDRVKLQQGELESYFCTNEDQVHPVADKIAETYSLDYSIIEGYLCGETPVPLGQIMLALQTAELTGGDYTAYLDGFEGISWGQIWQDLDLQGKPDHGTPPGQIKQQDGEGDPEEKIPPGQQKKEGEDLDLEELISEWLPQGWFQKGKK